MKKECDLSIFFVLGNSFRNMHFFCIFHFPFWEESGNGRFDRFGVTYCNNCHVTKFYNLGGKEKYYGFDRGCPSEQKTKIDSQWPHAKNGN